MSGAGRTTGASRSTALCNGQTMKRSTILTLLSAVLLGACVDSGTGGGDDSPAADFDFVGLMANYVYERLLGRDDVRARFEEKLTERVAALEAFREDLLKTADEIGVQATSWHFPG